MTERRIRLDDEGRPINYIDDFTAADAKRLYEEFLAAEEEKVKAEVRKILGQIREAATSGSQSMNVYCEAGRLGQIQNQLKARGFSVTTEDDFADLKQYLIVMW